MVPSIARQSVIIKCKMNKSVMTGNYEYFYGAGLLAKLYGVEIPDEIKPLELEELLTEAMKQLAPRDETESWLLQLLSGYKPSADYDLQMKELLLWGRQEEYLWSVAIPEMKKQE